jgi:DNA-binding transcriptional regulator YhcF (GntR family)
VSLTRTLLREQIRELLLERILKGELQSGDRIVELQIAQELGTSQASVREALKEGFPEKAGQALRQHFGMLQTMMRRGVNA